MTTPTATGPRWSTASFGDSSDSADGERSALGEHLRQCRRGHGRLHALGRGAEALHGFVVPRFVSTLALLAVLGALALVLL